MQGGHVQLTGGPLTGRRVLDFSFGMAGSLATLVLSDFGAEVVKVEPPWGDPFRRKPAWGGWNRGKKGIVLDLKTPEGQEQARRLAAAADVVVEAFRPGVAARLGIDYGTLSAVRPDLVYASISGFGERGPLAGIKGYEGVVEARAGRMLTFEGQVQRRGPVYTAVNVASWAASQGAVHGIVAALRVRDRTGLGDWVQTSLLQGVACHDLQGLLLYQLSLRDPVTFPSDADQRRRSTPTLQYLAAPCKDGRWIQLANNNSRLFECFIRAAGLWSIYRDERFKTAPDLTPENRELLRDMLFDTIRQKTRDEWMEIFIADGDVAAEPFMTTPQGMAHPQFVHNGHAVEVEDPEYGRMKVLGLLAELRGTPGRVQGPAPQLGEHTAEVLGEWKNSGIAEQRHSEDGAQPPPQSSVLSAQPSARPRYALEGITVLEFGTIIAVPYGCAMLADLGARVIKVEPPGGDHMRVLAGGFGTGAVKTTAGKESIEVDLKTPEGLEIVRRLIARSDVLVHNFRPGVPERLGIDYEAARAINPRIIHVYMGGYGDSGPYALRPAFHPLPGAVMGGALAQMGGGNPPPPGTDLSREEVRELSRRFFKANETNPDPNTSVAIVTAVLLALYARDRNGQGQQVVVTMLAANGYANADDAYRYPGRPPRRMPDSECYGLHALYRLYETAAGWVFLACPFQDEWERLCAVAGRPDLAREPRFAGEGERLAHDTELITVLEGLFKQRPAAEWERLCTAQDIACVRADAHNAGEFFYHEEHVRENGLVAAAEHARFGQYLRHAGLTRFAQMEGRYGPGVLRGQGSEALLREIGYTDGEIERLFAVGVLGREEV